MLLWVFVRSMGLICVLCVHLAIQYPSQQTLSLTCSAVLCALPPTQTQTLAHSHVPCAHAHTRATHNRSAIEAAVDPYVNDHFPIGVGAVYGSTEVWRL